MRNDSKKTESIKRANVQSYHTGEFYSENYAFHGFESNKLLTSDRYIRLDENFRRPDGLPLNGIGIEFEIECWNVLSDRAFAEIMDKIIFPYFPADMFKMQHDGSLGGLGAIGIECITQVMTIAFIRNNYRNFKAMFDYFTDFGISASKSGRCGMHVNISNSLFGKTEEKQKEAIRKLHYIINSNFSFACKLFKRNENRTGFCGRMNPNEIEFDAGNHHVCMNYSHFSVGRIELRLVGGQKDYYSFRNTMECVFFLIDRVKKLSWAECYSMKSIFTGCNQYVYKRLQDCELDDETMSYIHANLKPDDFDLHD